MLIKSSGNNFAKFYSITLEESIITSKFKNTYWVMYLNIIKKLL